MLDTGGVEVGVGVVAIDGLGVTVGFAEGDGVGVADGVADSVASVSKPRMGGVDFLASWAAIVRLYPVTVLALTVLSSNPGEVRRMV